MKASIFRAQAKSPYLSCLSGWHRQVLISTQGLNLQSTELNSVQNPVTGLQKRPVVHCVPKVFSFQHERIPCVQTYEARLKTATSIVNQGLHKAIMLNRLECYLVISPGFSSYVRVRLETPGASFHVPWSPATEKHTNSPAKENEPLAFPNHGSHSGIWKYTDGWISFLTFCMNLQGLQWQNITDRVT